MLGCKACKAKDDEIRRLWGLLESRDRAFLAMVDKRAHDARYLEERIKAQQQTPPEEQQPTETFPTSPMAVREQTVYEPALDYNRVEELFSAGDGEDIQ